MLLSLGLSGDLIGATVFAVNNTSAALHMVSCKPLLFQTTLKTVVRRCKLS
jgi:hypothetical protein